jgi:diphthamide biosynthesis methyltransferase
MDPALMLYAPRLGDIISIPARREAMYSSVFDENIEHNKCVGNGL